MFLLEIIYITVTLWLILGSTSAILFLGFEIYKGWADLLELSDIPKYLLMILAGLPSLIATVIVIYEDIRS